MKKNADDVITRFSRTVDQFLSEDEFREKLASGKRLRVKHALDVRTPVLHIGHAVNLWLLRWLQDMGHKVVLVFSDFTTRLGDLDGRLETLREMPEEEIQHNIREFILQAQAVLRFDDPDLIEVRRNSEWYKAMSVHDLLNVFSLVTYARLISRDLFQERIAEGREIYVHEMLYPLLQGYDSLKVGADVAIAGSDQLFAESLGRTLQEKHGMAPQTLLTTRYTAGTDGRRKQLRDLDNYIGLAHTPRDKFGRVMSIPDTLIEEYFRVYTETPLFDIAALDIEGRPRAAKLQLARAIVARYHGEDVAEAESQWFEKTFSRGQTPDDMPVIAIVADRMEALDLVMLARPGKSKGDSRRLIRQGGVDLDGRQLTDPAEMLRLKTGDVLKIGKRGWFRIEVVKLYDLETGGLRLKPMQVEQIELLAQYFPEGEIVQYLGGFKRVKGDAVRETFKKVILQPEPRDEWLWTVTRKDKPDDVIAVAHLKRDPSRGNQNIWIVPGQKDEDEVIRECMAVINAYAFDVLGLPAMEFKSAFAAATEPPSQAALHRSLARMRTELLNRETPEGAVGFTKEGWQMMQEWRRSTNPALAKKVLPPVARPRKKPAPPKKPDDKEPTI